jgi:hypothetical protein
MNPLNPRNPPLPFTLSDAPSSVAFFSLASLGLSLMFCAPPRKEGQYCSLRYNSITEQDG